MILIRVWLVVQMGQVEVRCLTWWPGCLRLLRRLQAKGTCTIQNLVWWALMISLRIPVGISLCVSICIYIYISVYSLLANSCFWMQELWTELLQFGVQSTQVRTKKTPTTNNLFFFCHLHSTLDGCIAVFHRGNSSWRSPKVSCREVLESCGTSLVEAQQMSTWRSWWNLRLLVKRGWWQVHSIYISPLSKYR